MGSVVPIRPDLPAPYPRDEHEGAYVMRDPSTGECLVLVAARGVRRERVITPAQFGRIIARIEDEVSSPVKAEEKDMGRRWVVQTKFGPSVLYPTPEAAHAAADELGLPVQAVDAEDFCDECGQLDHLDNCSKVSR